MGLDTGLEILQKTRHATNALESYGYWRIPVHNPCTSFLCILKNGYYSISLKESHYLGGWF